MRSLTESENNEKMLSVLIKSVMKDRRKMNISKVRIIGLFIVLLFYFVLCKVFVVEN